MRLLLGLICVFAMGAVPLLGCTETAGDGGSGGSAGTGGMGGDGGVGGDATCAPPTCPCERPLDDYCESSSCPTYEQALAAAEKSAVQSGCNCSPFPAAFGAGRCGDLRYVREDCVEENIEFFDASGTLVAAHWWTDDCGHVCQHSCSVDYGFRPECEKEQEQDFCEAPP
jgi:hypothetical protein